MPVLLYLLSVRLKIIMQGIINNEPSSGAIAHSHIGTVPMPSKYESGR